MLAMCILAAINDPQSFIVFLTVEGNTRSRILGICLLQLNYYSHIIPGSEADELSTVWQVYNSVKISVSGPNKGLQCEKLSQ